MREPSYQSNYGSHRVYKCGPHSPRSSPSLPSFQDTSPQDWTTEPPRTRSPRSKKSASQVIDHTTTQPLCFSHDNYLSTMTTNLPWGYISSLGFIGAAGTSYFMIVLEQAFGRPLLAPSTCLFRVVYYFTNRRCRAYFRALLFAGLIREGAVALQARDFSYWTQNPIPKFTFFVLEPRLWSGLATWINAMGWGEAAPA